MHIPVLLQEVVAALDPKPGEFLIDGTLGAGGHAKELIKKINPGGTLLAVDRDSRAVEIFKKEYAPPKTVQVVVEAASYAQLPEFLAKHKLPKADGLLLDLGFSSEQIGAGPSASSGQAGALGGRGFSFAVDEPLLMTYDDETPSVAKLLAELSEEDLTAIIREYGEERYAEQIAARIMLHAKTKGIATTKQLVDAIREGVPAGYEHGRLHPATRTFQALRIYANSELRHLERLLAELPKVVKRGGRAAIISFHSLEDRIVKNYFRQYLRSRSGGSVETDHRRDFGQAGELPNSASAPKKPILASEAEIAANPRSRSAKLRILTL